MRKGVQDIFSVREKIVIVTGAANGNGYAIAKGFLQLGAIVCFVDISASLNEVVKKLGNSRAHGFLCDLRDPQAIRDLVEAIITKFGRIDVLVNNAGISLSHKNPYDEAVFEETMKVNLRGPFLLSQLVASAMRKRRCGAIINVTSLGSELGFPNNPSYQASKAGLRQLGKAMARDWAGDNIRVNNVCPGYLRTQMTEKSYQNPTLREERSKRTILGRWGQPEDLIGTCVFLASDASSYITGIDLPVDGGWLAKGL